MKIIHIKIPIPENLPSIDEGLIMAQNKAKEAAVISLWQSGRLTLRQAAQALDVTYRGFLKILGEKRIPILSEGPDEKVVQELIRQKQEEKHKSAA